MNNIKVPEVERCCFCLPLRPGIIVFGYVNILFSILAISSLIITTETQEKRIDDDSLEDLTSTSLFAILGMGVILNIMLLVAGSQKDIAMLRLYSYYLIATTTAALVPTFILLTLGRVFDVCAACFAIAMQCYVFVLVRSEVVRLELRQLDIEVGPSPGPSDAVCVPDTETLL